MERGLSSWMRSRCRERGLEFDVKVIAGKWLDVLKGSKMSSTWPSHSSKVEELGSEDPKECVREPFDLRIENCENGRIMEEFRDFLIADRKLSEGQLKGIYWK